MQVDIIVVIKTLLAAQNVQLTKIEPPFAGLDLFDYGLRKRLDPMLDWADFGAQMMAQNEENILALVEDIFGVCFAMFSLPDEPGHAYIAGPWMAAGFRPEEAGQLRWVQRHLGEDAAHKLTEYYNSVPLLQGEQMITQLVMLLRCAYPEKDIKVQERQEFLPLITRPDHRFFTEPAFQQELEAAIIEQRYQAENQILEAVARGDITAAIDAGRRFQRFRFDGRYPGALRSQKNLLLSFNTLLRKAIERSGVPPFYMDQISQKYAAKIEEMVELEQQPSMISDMLREYCFYVEKYALKDYSPPVQKVIQHIDRNMDSQLSLKNLAALCFISPSYLSTLFKQETGQTLTDYISSQRIHRASVLLAADDHCSVADIAGNVGIMDVNYFTKIFKKMLGVTPTQYRREVHERYKK